MTTPLLTTVEALQAAGAAIWESPDGSRRRAYFNDLLDLFGIEATFYKTGNVQRATLDGNDISNCEFKRISGDLTFAKTWVDLTDGQLYSKGYGSRAGYAYPRYIEAEIRKRVVPAAAAMQVATVTESQELPK